MSASQSKHDLTLRIFIGMVAGIFVGILLNWLFDDSGDYVFVAFGSSFSAYGILVEGIFNVIGTIFINCLKMLVVPLVFVSLVSGVCRLSDPSKLGRLGIKAIGLYLGTTAIAVSTALFFAILVGPGEGVALDTSKVFEPTTSPGLAAVIIGMFPQNPISAMAEGNMLQVIIFSILFGVAIALSGKAGENVANLFDNLNEVVLKLVMILMNLAPYGVFALMAKMAATTDERAFVGLAQYFSLVAGLLIAHGLFTYSLLFKLLTGYNPIPFMFKMPDTWLFAFSTSSSNATMPVTFETATEKLGASRQIASFTVPLGATINMDGTAIMQGVATAFIAQMYGIDLSGSDLLMVILTATLASVGTAGVPGVGLIMLGMVLQQVNLPAEAIGMIMGIDRLLDMTRTMVNVTGDSMVTCAIAKSEGEFDEKIYFDPNAGEKAENVDLSKPSK